VQVREEREVRDGVESVLTRLRGKVEKGGRRRLWGGQGQAREEREVRDGVESVLTRLRGKVEKGGRR
jgi:hypothetical protein